MTNSNPIRNWWGRKKPVYQNEKPEPPAPAVQPTTSLPPAVTPYAPLWTQHPVAQRLYAENQRFIDQANRACEQAARRGF